MDRKEFEFVFGDMTIGEYLEGITAIKLAVEGNIMPMFNYIDRYLIGRIDEIPVEYLQYVMSEFASQFENYQKEMFSAFAKD